MSWKKHFQAVSPERKLERVLATQRNSIGPNDTSGTSNKYSSYLPEVYAGAPNRLERYSQYDYMDMDSEVNVSLDTIADFCTQAPDDEDTPFYIHYYGQDQVTGAEVEVLNETLNQWVEYNDWNRAFWEAFRSTIKYGDQFFIRDPETFIWHWVNPYDVKQVIVNEAKGKKPEYYIISNVDFNLQSKVATRPKAEAMNVRATETNPTFGNGAGTQNSPQSNQSAYLGKSSGQAGLNELAVSAEHVIHLSLSVGMDAYWPFGKSILDSVFKPFKQKELLEDALIIYRVQRAPERRVFYVDVGNLPPHKAGAFLERIKNEIHQRRIPNRTGGGTSILDAAYNPLSIIEDYFFAQTADGRGSKVDTLPGGENLGQIDDLKFFNNKLIRGLRVPSAYLPTGPEDGTQTFTDGRVGTAYIQEFRFGKYCLRLQRLVSKIFDEEFKLFLAKKGVTVDTSIFELRFWPPQNFAKFRQIEIDTAQAGVFSQLADVPYLSKRFILERYLGLKEDEVLLNERMWRDENSGKIKKEAAQSMGGGGGAPSAGLADVGIRPDAELSPDGMDADMDMGPEGGEMDMGAESPISGGETTPFDTGGEPPAQ